MSTHKKRVKDLAQLLEIDKTSIINSFDFRYTDGDEWGIIQNPATWMSSRIARSVEHMFPYTRADTIYSLLTNVFDNATNYRPLGQDAQATTIVAQSKKSLEIIVANVTDRDLPDKLNNKTYHASQGIVRVPKKQRDSHSGGGARVPYITECLPYLYSSLVQTKADPSVSWTKIKDKVIFTLTIPNPTAKEMVACNDYTARRDRKEAAYQAVKTYITKPPKRVSTKELPILKEVLQAHVGFPENIDANFLDLAKVLEIVKNLGKKVGDVADDLVDIIQSGAAAVHGMEALEAIEAEKGMYAQRFLTFVNTNKVEGKMVMNVQVQYLMDNVPEKKKTNKLLDMYLTYVVSGIHQQVEMLSTLSEGKLKERTIKKILSTKHATAYDIYNTLQVVDNKHHEPLVKKLVAYNDPHYATEVLSNTRDSFDFVGDLITVITESNSAHYASKVIGMPHISSDYHHELVKKIEHEASAYHAIEAMSNVSDTLVPRLVDVIVKEGSPHYASEAIRHERVPVSDYPKLVQVIANEQSKYYANDALESGKIIDSGLIEQLKVIAA